MLPDGQFRAICASLAAQVEALLVSCVAVARCRSRTVLCASSSRAAIMRQMCRITDASARHMASSRVGGAWVTRGGCVRGGPVVSGSGYANLTSCACCPAACEGGGRRQGCAAVHARQRARRRAHFAVEHHRDVVLDLLLRQRQAERLTLAAADPCGGRAGAVVVPARHLRRVSFLGSATHRRATRAARPQACPGAVFRSKQQ